MLRARRSIRNKYKTPLGKATKKRFRMRSNPQGFKEIVKITVPVVVSLYGSRALSTRLAPMVPGLNAIPAQFQGIAMAGVVMVGAHFATKKVRFLKKHRGGIMIGTTINLFDQAVMAFAPESVKQMVGVGEYVQVGGMGEYVQVGDAPPIDDDITLAGLSDYIEVGELESELGQVESELGMLESELGVESDLGADPLSKAYLGGTPRSSMLKPVPHQAMVAAVPKRSFTKQIPHAGAGYDNPDVLYGGIFSGGFGY